MEDEGVLKAYYCGVCKRKLFYGLFFGAIEIRCPSCKSDTRFVNRPSQPRDAEAVEKMQGTTDLLSA